MPIAYIDTETTGLAGTDVPIEVACVCAGDSFSSLISDPAVLPSPQAVMIHGITPARLVDEGRPLVDVLADLTAFFEKHQPSALAGWNLRFDLRMLLRVGWQPPENVRLVCCMTEYRRKHKPQKWNLISAAKRFGVSTPTHGALADAQTVAELDAKLQLSV